MKMKKTVSLSELSELADKINRALKTLELDLKGRTVRTYWGIGRWISLKLLQNEDRAGYGEHLYAGLSPRVRLSARTLMRTVDFYKSYPILTHVSKLTWTHFLQLMGIFPVCRLRAGGSMFTRSWRPSCAAKTAGSCKILALTKMLLKA